jgi:hypothetical protein
VAFLDDGAVPAIVPVTRQNKASGTNEGVCRLSARHLSQGFVAQNPLPRAVGSDFDLPPADRPPPSSLQKTTASILPF